MKLRTILSLIAASLVCMSARAEASIHWLNPTHSFGAFHEEMGAVTCTFLGVNNGTDSLVVIDARANCGCTRPTYSRKPVAPGDTLRISVSYDPSGRPGRFDKQVRVTTNASSTPTVLHVKGTVIGTRATLNSRYPVEVGQARLNTDVCPFGQTFRGHVLASAINIYNAGLDTIRPYISQKSEVFNAIFQPEAIAPGEQGIVSLTAYTDRVPQWGLVTDSIVLVPDGGAPVEHPIAIPTTMILNEDFSQLTPEQRAEAPAARVNPGTLDFSIINRESAPRSLTLTVSNVGKKSMIIRRIYSPCEAISISSIPKRIAPGKSKDITVTLDPSLLTDDNLLNERIILITNSPSNHNLTIRVVGTISR